MKFAAGIHTIDATITIRAKRPDFGTGVPAPYEAQHDAHSWPADSLSGAGRAETVLRFPGGPERWKGNHFIETEFFGSGKVTRYWNCDNTIIDTTIKGGQHAVLCGSANNFTVDGCAELRLYPYMYRGWSPQPDPHGPDFVPYADGLCVMASGFKCKNLRFYRVPGTALL